MIVKLFCNSQITWYIGRNLTMKSFQSIIVLIWSIIWLVNCVPHRRRKSETIQKRSKSSGEVTVVDHLIQKYEKEHQKLCEEKTGDGEDLEWPALDSKNLSEYCRKFLQHSLPGRKTDTAIGSKIKKVLNYEYRSTTSNIVIVRCKLTMNQILCYYITRAPEPNCVYAVKCTHSGRGRKFNIIHKYCDFEKRPLKQKRAEIIGKMHHHTGQPIAKDKYLLEYELEHQELLRQEGDNGKRLEWSRAILHDNLDTFCHQYLGECVPSRNGDDVTGTWKTEKFHYQKLNANEAIEVTTVTCRLTFKSTRHYHMTRAPERNCVYALLRKNRNSHSPLMIIFKHCDFENLKDQHVISHDINTLDKIIPKIEAKEEILDSLETLQFFPEN